MSGCYKGLRGRIKVASSHLVCSYCCIHRQSLADSMKEVLNQSVKVLNFIKANTTNTRLFKSLFEDMGCLNTALLLHTEVCCLVFSGTRAIFDYAAPNTWYIDVTKLIDILFRKGKS
ncbi:hypothetical protein AVEN_84675-1 [Araneus ventricosus]|uniref:Zinc finger BED domain-containing protein 5 n=1 Tax=Araneus ventricosus TaxID=182803 RepID=A0A4Y2UGG3_ARAVE|nr:hypothetical protein AVEN_84675-1 [Araneus ventricosus]